MNKELKKSIETELVDLLTGALTARDANAAAEVSKTIKEGVKSIAKKFVKHLNPTEKPVKKSKAEEKKIKVKKSSKKVSSGKKAARKKKSTPAK